MIQNSTHTILNFNMIQIFSIMITWITREGPPAVISGGICDNGQFSIDIISSDEQSASSNGRL